jgi:hypothetical protein
MIDPQKELQGAFAELVFFALDHAVESVRSSGGPLTPFVVTEAEGQERRLSRYAAARLEESLAHARAAALSGSGAVDRWVLAWDGYLTPKGGERTDAIYVEAGQRGKAYTLVLAQRYRRGANGFEGVGNAAFLGEGTLLKQVRH